MESVSQRIRDYTTPLLLVGVTLAAAAAAGLFAARLPLGAFLAILGLPLVAALLFWPDLATLVVLFVMYTNTAVLGVKFHGIPYMVGAAYPLLIALPLMVSLLFRREKIVFTPVLPLLIVFFGIQILGALTAKDFRSAASNVITNLIEGLMFYLMIVNAIRTPAMLRRAIWTLVLAGVLIGGIPLYQQVTGTFNNEYWGYAQVTDATFRTGEETIQGDVRQPRLAGPIGEQNRYAQIMLMLVPFGLYLFWAEKRPVLKLLALATTAIAAGGMALAFSRGAAVAFVIMLILMVFTRNIKPVQFAGILLTGVLLLAAFPQYGMRLASLQSITGLASNASAPGEEVDGAIKGRATAMLAAAHTFLDHPIIGVGPGMTKFYTQEYGNRLGLRILTEDREAHSLYLAIAADHGLLGLVCFLAILYVTLRNLVRARKYWMETRPDLANLITGVSLSLVSYLCTGIFLHMSYARYFWLALALANVAAEISLHKESGQPAPAGAAQ